MQSRVPRKPRGKKHPVEDYTLCNPASQTAEICANSYGKSTHNHMPAVNSLDSKYRAELQTHGSVHAILAKFLEIVDILFISVLF